MIDSVIDLTVARYKSSQEAYTMDYAIYNAYLPFCSKQKDKFRFLWFALMNS